MADLLYFVRWVDDGRALKDERLGVSNGEHECHGSGSAGKRTLNFEHGSSRSAEKIICEMT